MLRAKISKIEDTDRDYYERAGSKEYGLVDEVMEKRRYKRRVNNDNVFVCGRTEKECGKMVAGSVPVMCRRIRPGLIRY